MFRLCCARLFDAFLCRFARGNFSRRDAEREKTYQPFRSNEFLRLGGLLQFHVVAQDGVIRVEIHEDTSSPYKGLWSEFFSGAWEPETFIIFRDFIGDGGIVVDAGAAMGMTALLAATCAKNVRVIAIEPYRPFLAELSANIAQNPHLKISLYKGAIGDFNGEAPLQKESSNNKLFSDIVISSTEHDKGYTVEVATLSSIMSKFDLERLDFFKIDIEGGEYRVLPACRDVFRRHRPTIRGVWCDLQ